MSTVSNPVPERLTAMRNAGGVSLRAEIWNNRSILWLLTRRDLQARYAGSTLGVMWNVIHPIVMIAIYILILGTIMAAKTGGTANRLSYAIYLCAGMIPWLVFREIVTRCASTILDNASLIKKVAFPEVVLHLSVLINALIIHTISFAAFILILLGVHVWPGVQVFACFPLMIAVAVFGLGVGLIVSVLNIYFRDAGQIVEIALQFLFWFTPIVYPLSLIQGKSGSLMHWVSRLLEWNPLVHFVRLGQWMFGAMDVRFSWVSLAVVVFGPIVSLAIGLLLFNHFKHDLLDNV